uniref:Uncharacterized protein n=1 Tax=Candidatus Kentrum sp. FM TaxID=2126340 RepID=A0A450RW45_9GAMM|nr:MAG: hypothetical protein BECKFM1743A_GA0114220_1000110 [Candidatus Kentron sp. FM]VFJ43340.1 MAG: hypothetical protein BECKFM1743C_GA0114222_1000110 [Candidatus Kentron sp. FM]VFK05502.1 MAG: hypothetical protein BECKFM1743B_GA0114221_1000110 [Candidatus Kentron sp. FM]
MSSPQQITIVQVNAAQQETIQLADVLGRVPTDEIREVLGSQWAKDKGWQQVKENSGELVYQRQITETVGMSFRIADSGEVRLERRTGAVGVKNGQAETERAKHENALKTAENDYNLAFNEILAEALVKAVPNRAKELGYLVEPPTVTVQQDTGIREMVMLVNV